MLTLRLILIPYFVAIFAPGARSQNVYIYPAMGYIAKLGDIYNESSETISSLSIFKRKPPFNITDTKFVPQSASSSKFEIINALQDKVKLLGVDPTFVTRLKTHFIVPNRTLNAPMALDYLDDEKKYTRQTEGALYQRIRTRDEILRTQQDLRQYLKSNRSDPNWNPLIVVRIVYGSNLVVKVLVENVSAESKELQDSNLKEAMSRTMSNQNITKAMNSLNVTVFSDIYVPHNIFNLGQVSELLKDRKLRLKKAKGVPIEYTMVRLSDLHNISNLNFERVKTKFPYDFQTSSKLGKTGIFRYLSDIITATQIVSDFQADMTHHKACIAYREQKDFKSFASTFNKRCRDLKNLAKNYNSYKDLSRFLGDLNALSEDVSLAKVQPRLEREFAVTRIRIDNCKQFEEKGVKYFGDYDLGDDFEEHFWESHSLVFVMYYSLELAQADPGKFAKNVDSLTALKESVPPDQLLILDCEFHPTNCVRLNTSGTVIRMFEDKKLKIADVATNFVDALLYMNTISHRTSTVVVIDTTTEGSARNETESPTEEEQSTASVAIVGAVLAVLGVILGVMVVVVWTARKKIASLKNVIRRLSETEVQQFFEGDPNFDESIPNAPIEAMPFDKKYEIAEDDLIVHSGKVIGSGHFGVVMRGSLKDDVGGHLEVAVKTSKASSDVTYFKSLLGELKILAYLGHHENIASLIGAVTTNIQSQQVLIATEWCQNGDLKRFLVKNRKAFTPKFRPQNSTVQQRTPMSVTVIECSRNFSTLDLLRWSLQIAKGMRYLEEKKIIHGDLATRNVLLTTNNDAKISDFGLSRQLIKYSNYKKKSMDPLPWRWMAIEALRDLSFSLQSDVWSYGVTVWEIFSLGEVPFPGQVWDGSFLSKLISGDRLNRPQFANAHVYNMMLDTWQLEPSERPSFSTVIEQLQGLMLDMGSCDGNV